MTFNLQNPFSLQSFYTHKKIGTYSVKNSSWREERESILICMYILLSGRSNKLAKLQRRKTVFCCIYAKISIMNLSKQKSNVCLPGDGVGEKELLPITMSVGNCTLSEPAGNVCYVEQRLTFVLLVPTQNTRTDGKHMNKLSMKYLEEI